MNATMPSSFMTTAHGTMKIVSTSKKEILRNAMKGYAEDAKVQLSDNPTTDIATFPGDIRATDDDGTEFNLNMTISQEQLAEVFSPIYQKAIDITKKILTKNNLKGSQLECLILASTGRCSNCIYCCICHKTIPQSIVLL